MCLKNCDPATNPLPVFKGRKISWPKLELMCGKFRVLLPCSTCTIRFHDRSVSVAIFHVVMHS